MSPDGSKNTQREQGAGTELGQRRPAAVPDKRIQQGKNGFAHDELPAQAGTEPLAGHVPQDGREPGRAKTGQHAQQRKAHRVFACSQPMRVSACGEPHQQCAQAGGHAQPVGPVGGVDFRMPLEPGRELRMANTVQLTSETIAKPMPRQKCKPAPLSAPCVDPIGTCIRDIKSAARQITLS